MHRRGLWAFAVAALAAVALTATGSARIGATGSSDAKTLVFAAEHGAGPDYCLNRILEVDCGDFWNGMFETPVIRGAFLFTPDFKYKPDLISRYTLKLHPMRVTYFIRQKARWSDGVPVTGKDWRFTWQTVMTPQYTHHIREEVGWADISSVRGSGKIVTVTFKQDYAAWRELFGYVLPEHALEGTDLLTVWNDCICNPKRDNTPIGDGPFLLTRFDRSSGVTLKRNPRGWYGQPAKLDSIVFRFITNPNSEIQAIRSGEVDAAYPQPQAALAGLRGQPGLRVVTHLGLIEEHIAIEAGPRGNPLAKQRWLRQALISSLNRQAVVKAVYGQLNPHVKVLNSVSRLSNEPMYDPTHFNKWTYSVNRVNQMMKAHNCTKGDDGTYRCDGTKVSFELASTSDNPSRILAFTIMKDQAAKAGIELRYGFLPASSFFAELDQDDYELAMFGWSVSLDPNYVSIFFRCYEHGYNWLGYCNQRVTRLLLRSDRELNQRKRIALVNQAGAIIGNDVPLIPLFQKPTYLVYKTTVKGMVDNPSDGTPAFNAENWSKG
jgi:peptide/nickel transport system substrate-binding protein